MVERHNKQIIDELQKRLAQFGSSWPDQLPFVQYAYNSTPHSKTKEAPFKVVFGTEPPLPNFEDVDIDHHQDKTVRKYVEDLQKRLQTIHKAVKERVEKKIEQEKASYNKSEKHTPLKVGDIVYEKENVRASKLTPKWKAEPVTVLERCKTAKGEPGYTYIVKRADGSEHRRNYEQLKLAKAHFPENTVVTTEQVRVQDKRTETIAVLWDSDDDSPITSSLPGFKPLPAPSSVSALVSATCRISPTSTHPYPATVATATTIHGLPQITTLNVSSLSSHVPPVTSVNGAIGPAQIPLITTLNVSSSCAATPPTTVVSSGSLPTQIPLITTLNVSSSCAATPPTTVVSSGSLPTQTPLITTLNVSAFCTATPPTTAASSGALSVQTPSVRTLIATPATSENNVTNTPPIVVLTLSSPVAETPLLASSAVTPTHPQHLEATGNTPSLELTSASADTPDTVIKVVNVRNNSNVTEILSAQRQASTREPSSLPPIPPGSRSRTASYSGEPLATSRKGLGSPRAVRTNSTGTPVKVGESRDKSGGKLKAKNRRKSTSDADDSGVQDNTIYNFTQFLRHSSAERTVNHSTPEVNSEERVGTEATSETGEPRQEPVFNLAEEISARQRQIRSNPPPHPLIARFQLRDSAFNRSLLSTNQPLHLAGLNRRVDSDSDANSQDFGTAEEGSSSEDSFHEAVASVRRTDSPIAASNIQLLNISEQEVQPRYNLRSGNRNGQISQSSEGRKRDNSSLELSADSAQSPKHLLYDEQILQTSPRLDFTRIAFVPQPTDQTTGEDSYRAVAYRTAGISQPDSNIENPSDPQANNLSIMELDDVFD